jgi:molybdopterin converting factor small subunit
MLREAYPGVEGILDRCCVTVNLEQVDYPQEDPKLHANDEIAILPPVSGG